MRIAPNDGQRRRGMNIHKTRSGSGNAVRG
jgi:hypothetical protein